MPTHSYNYRTNQMEFRRGLLVTTIISAVLFLFGIAYIVASVRASYQYEREVSSYWSLGEKASSLDVKAQYVDKYVAAIEQAQLSGNNAIVFPTPDNSYEQNYIALKSLQTRLHEIQQMDVKSFEYQQAISQITAQEQGEAQEMLGIFEGLWFLKYHFFMWSWIGGLVLLVGVVGSAIALIVCAMLWGG